MKGFYWGTGRVRCSFCGMVGHNITTCKSVSQHATNALIKIQNNPNYICNAFELNALKELKKREERKTKLKKPKARPRCSYCKSYNHKRPKCQDLKDFRQLVYKANKNWKRTMVSRVNETGLGIGSLIKFDTNIAYNLDFNIDPHMIAMITHYDLGSLNLFCALDVYSDYQSNSTIRILSGERTDNISVKYLSSLLGYDLLHQGWWYSHGTVRVLNPMRWEPEKEWLESEWDEVLDWFFKSVKKKDLINEGIMSFIENWANKV